MSGRQWLRHCDLIVSGNSRDGLNLSELHVKFSITKSDAESPNVADITVYNLAADTAQRIKREFTRVTLQAGYVGNFGVIFDGQIRQVRIGRDNATDTFLNIIASDGAAAYQFATVNTTLAAGSSVQDWLKAAIAPMADLGVVQGLLDSEVKSKPLPRGKVMYGASRDHMRSAARTAGATWSIQDGETEVLRRTALRPGQAVLLSPSTGLIGTPEQTEDGVVMRSLINPMIRVNGAIKLEADVLEKKLDLTAKSTSTTTEKPPSPIAANGLYRALWLEYQGDTRGNDWYCDITGLAADASAPAGKEVSPS